MNNQSLPPSLKLKSNPVQTHKENQPSSLKLKNQNLPASLKLKNENFPLENENDLDREIERNQAQQTSRMLEGVFGLPGDLINFAGSALGFEPKVPGSQKLREVSENISQGYTKPKNEEEEKVGNIMQDIALFAIPGAKHYSLARNIGIPLVSELAKEGIKYAGGDDKKQAYGKIGTMVMLDLLSHRKALGTAKEYASSLFKKADEAIPKGLSINATNLEKSLNKLEETFKMGGSRPSTPEALEKLSEIRGEIKNGKINLKNLVAYRPAINEWIDKAKGFEIGGNSDKIRRQIIHNLNDVKGEVIKAAEEYGAKYNPEYLKLSQNANEAYSAYAQSNKISNFIEKKVGSKIQSKALKAILGLGGLGSLGGAAGLGTTLLAGSVGLTTALGYKAFKTILRGKSPTLRKHYFNILEGALKGNTSQVLKNTKELDKIFQEIEKTGEFDSD